MSDNIGKPTDLAVLEHLQRWYERDLARYAPWEKTAQIDETRFEKGIEGVPTPRSLRFHLHTDRNRYHFHAREPENKPAWYDRDAGKWNFDLRAAQHNHGPNDAITLHMVPDKGYLGCIASSRKCRVGEDWTRGSDLPDGPLSEGTWRSILNAILSYELLPVGKEAREALRAKYAQLGPAGAASGVEEAMVHGIAAMTAGPQIYSDIVGYSEPAKGPVTYQADDTAHADTPFWF